MIDYKTLSLNIGLPMQFAIKEFHMFDLFSKLLASGWNLPLVGGTAINKIYLTGEDRFSEDLDFELYGKEKINPPKLEGYSIKGPFVYRRNIRFEAEYKELGKKDRIRIDINIKPKTRINTIRKTAIFLTGNTITGLDTFTLEGLIARKALAITRRIDGKDFYDIWHSIQKLNFKLLEKEIKWISNIEKTRNLISEAEDVLKDINTKELSKFNNYIPINRRPDWKLVKNDILQMFERLAK